VKLSRTIAAAAALALLTGATAFHQPLSVHAQDQELVSVIDRISFGMVGFTSGQAIRLSVVNGLPPGPTLPPGPIRVVMAFRDMNGQLLRNLKSGEVVRRVVNLARGEAAFLDLDYDELPPGPSRLQVRGVVTAELPPGPIRALPPSPIVPSLEVIDSDTGRTQFVISNPGVIRGFNPQPDPPRETDGPIR